MSSSANISADLDRGFAEVDAHYAAARAAPLSRKHAMLVALLIDRLVDRLFATTPGADDILVFRAGFGASSPDLALVLGLAGLQPDGPRLATEAVEVSLADYPALALEDFMVSLYNAHTVQRVRIVEPDGTRHDALDVLGAAIAALGRFRSR